MATTDSYATLRRLLGLTKKEELDCDTFRELTASYLDDAVDDPDLLALIEHHRELCGECAEELEVLERALGTAAHPSTTRAK